MTEREQYFRERFYRWRQDKAKNEEAVLLTILHIDAYMRAAFHLKGIKSDFYDHTSLKYNELNRYGKREFGVLLYCKFIIQDYFEHANEEEQELLSVIVKKIDGLYEQGRVDTQAKLNALTESCHFWLDNYTQNREDVSQIQSLCCVLYLLLKVLEIFLKNLGGWSKQLAKPFINLDLLVNEIESLLVKTEERFNQLNTILNQDKPCAPQNLAELFDKKYLELVASNPANHYDVLLAKISLLETMVIEAKTMGLLLKRNYEFKKNLQNAQSFLSLIEDNGKYIIGRKYFLDLIKENDKSFQDLMNCLNSEQRTAFLDKVEQLKNPTHIQKFYASLQYSASWATALPASAFRLTVPQDWQNYVVGVIPDTLDSQCKNDLKCLIEIIVKDLKEKLVATENEMQLLTEKFAADQRYEQFIKDIPIEVIEQIVASSQTMMESLAMYKNLLLYANSRQKTLQEIHGLHEQIDDFLQLHDNFWVKLSNFLATFFSFFRTETACLVAKVRDIQNKLNTLKCEYSSDFDKACEAYLQKHERLHPQLHNLLVEEAKGLDSLIPRQNNTVIAKTSVRESFSHIRQCFFYVKENPVQLAEMPVSHLIIVN
ncbi:hypothetical protein A8135_11650 [Legionella jamestowniensis]|uniref:Purine NTPase n=1 Tax=Legionella jamestowniensis TaxID=455 RepID=A0ABX2XUF7_9GAMM|nr:hypothetical protein [Legionella jamestowniensis]OCH98215.1 hypothetical protein A8135_11650 [Legionella jamestowniensis]